MRFNEEFGTLKILSDLKCLFEIQIVWTWNNVMNPGKWSRTKVNFKIRNHIKRQIRRTKIRPQIAWPVIESRSSWDWSENSVTKINTVMMKNFIQITSVGVVWIWRTTFGYSVYFNCCFICCLRFYDFHFAGSKR